MGLTIGIDVGGTKVAAGVVDERGHIVAEVRRETPARDPKAVEDTIAAAVEDLAPGTAVDAVGVRAAGFHRRERGQRAVRAQPRLDQ